MTVYEHLVAGLPVAATHPPTIAHVQEVASSSDVPGTLAASKAVLA